MTKSMFLALAAAACMLGSSSALAALVTISEDGVVIASWTQSLTPTPVYVPTIPPTNYVLDQYTRVPILYSTFPSGDGPVAWYSIVDQTGGVTDYDGTINITGPQVYAGLESAPVFTPGVWIGLDQNDQQAATITISVPEPATWAMMLVGMGMIGFAARNRRSVHVRYA